jgi:hypothetical protein
MPLVASFKVTNFSQLLKPVEVNLPVQVQSFKKK